MTKRSIKLICAALILSMMLSLIASCNVSSTLPNDPEEPSQSDSAPQIDTPAETPFETPAESGQSGSLSPETPPQTPADTGVSGELGGAVMPEEEEKETPETPQKSLYEKSQETYSSGKLGCNSITVHAEYTPGLDIDLVATKDSTNKLFYIFLPCRADISKVYFSVTHRNGSVSGPYLADFSDDTVSNNEKTIGGASVYTIKAFRSNLPSMFLNIDETYGTIKEMKGDASHSKFAYGSMLTTVTDEMASKNEWATHYVSVDENPDKYCSMSIRGRGNATWGYTKKPYQIKFENDVNLLGMGYSDTYILLANYRDGAGTRSKVALDLAAAMGIDFSSQSRLVDLFMNGEYLGMYQLTEKVEAGVNRVEIDHTEDVLYEADNYATKEGEFGFQTDYTNANMRGFRIHSPENTELLDAAKEKLIDAETALYRGTDKQFEKYFDLDSWARMYLLQLYTMNSDAYYGSFFFYYDATDGKLHTCAPWDFDWSFGVSWGGDNFKDPNKYDLTSREWMNPMFKRRNFKLALVEAYYEGGCKEEIAKAPQMILDLAAENKLSAEMNHTLGVAYYYPTSSVSFYPSTVSNYDEAVEYFHYIASERIDWLEKRMADIASEVGYRIP